MKESLTYTLWPLPYCNKYVSDRFFCFCLPDKQFLDRFSQVHIIAQFIQVFFTFFCIFLKPMIIFIAKLLIQICFPGNNLSHTFGNNEPQIFMNLLLALGHFLVRDLDTFFNINFCTKTYVILLLYSKFLASPNLLYPYIKFPISDFHF